MVNIGLRCLNVGFRGPGFLRETAQAAEEAGVESLWVADHIAVPARPAPHQRARTDGDFVDAFASLGFLAAVTERVLLGAGVLVLPLRHPLQVAKAAAGLHALSAGRFLLGVGCGWLEPEFRALGVDFAARGALTDEYLRALRAVWDGGSGAFAGEFVGWRDMVVGPRPDGGGVPVVVGGESSAALRRALRHGDAFFPTGPHRLALARALRGQRPGMPVTLPLHPDGTAATETVGLADRVVLTVRGTGDATDFAVREPEDVAVVVGRVRELNRPGARPPG